MILGQCGHVAQERSKPVASRGVLMTSMFAEPAAEVRVRRHSGVPECDVIVTYRGREISLRCRNYKQAVEWARIECKSYKIADGFTVES